MRLPVLFILVTVTLDAMGIGLIMPIMPDLIQEVRGGGLSNAAVWGGVLATVFAVMQFGFGPLVGSLSDRYGRRPVLLISLFFMALDYLVMALAGSIWLLRAGRVVGGITAATHGTAAAYMADISTPHEKAANFGLIGAGFAPVEGPELQRARKWVGEAQRPLVIAGLDALNDGASEALGEFVRAVGAPLVTTYKAKGILDEDHPSVLGGAGLSPLADRHIMPLIEASDCIVLAGYDPIEMRVGWRDPWPDDARVIDITPVVRTHGMHSVQATLYGSVGATLLDLCDELATHPTWPRGGPTATRKALREAFAPEPEGWGPAAAFHALREALPPETVASADSGAHRILLSQVWRCPGPRRLIQSTALCTMGCSVALAAGHKHAAPEIPVVAFVGDAGLEMTLGDLATLRDLRLAVPVVVLIDESLALIEMKQRGVQLQNVGVDFPGTDFVALAAAMGGHGVWIDDTETLAREARAALDRPTFTLLCVRIGRRAYDGKF